VASVHNNEQSDGLSRNSEEPSSTTEDHESEHNDVHKDEQSHHDEKITQAAKENATAEMEPQQENRMAGVLPMSILNTNEEDATGRLEPQQEHRMAGVQPTNVASPNEAAHTPGPGDGREMQAHGQRMNAGAMCARFANAADALAREMDQLYGKWHHHYTLCPWWPQAMHTCITPFTSLS